MQHDLTALASVSFSLSNVTLILSAFLSAVASAIFTLPIIPLASLNLLFALAKVEIYLSDSTIIRYVDLTATSTTYIILSSFELVTDTLGLIIFPEYKSITPKFDYFSFQ